MATSAFLHKAASAPPLCRPRNPRSTPLFQLVEAHYEDVKGLWEDRFPEHLRPVERLHRRNTVAKAYAELESQGVIETAVGRGSFVRPNASPLKKEVRRKLLAGMIDEAAVHAHHMQIGKAEFLKLAEDRYDALEDKRTQAQRS